MRNIFIVTALALMIFLNSCQQYHDTNRQEELATIGMNITKSFKDVYKTVKENEYFYDLNNKELNILISSDSVKSDTIKFKKAVDYNNALELIESMHKVYISYNEFCQPRATAESSGIRKTVREFCDKIIDFKLNNEDDIKIDKIKAAANNPTFMKKEVMNLVSSLYTTKLSKNIEENIKILNENYILYSNKVEKIPESSFEYERLKKIIDEPYKDNKILVKLFKLKRKEKALKDKNDLTAKLKKYQKIFKKAHKIHEKITIQGTKDTDFDILLREIKLLTDDLDLSKN